VRAAAQRVGALAEVRLLARDLVLRHAIEVERQVIQALRGDGPVEGEGVDLDEAVLGVIAVDKPLVIGPIAAAIGDHYAHPIAHSLPAPE
jgi:hypothetical protein